MRLSNLLQLAGALTLVHGDPIPVRRGRRTSTACNETLTIVVTPTPSTYPVISTSTAGGTNNSSASYLSGAPVTANGYSVPYTNQTAVGSVSSGISPQSSTLSALSQSGNATSGSTTGSIASAGTGSAPSTVSGGTATPSVATGSTGPGVPSIYPFGTAAPFPNSTVPLSPSATSSLSFYGSPSSPSGTASAPLTSETPLLSSFLNSTAVPLSSGPLPSGSVGTFGPVPGINATVYNPPLLPGASTTGYSSSPGTSVAFSAGFSGTLASAYAFPSAATSPPFANATSAGPAPTVATNLGTGVLPNGYVVTLQTVSLNVSFTIPPTYAITEGILVTAPITVSSNPYALPAPQSTPAGTSLSTAIAGPSGIISAAGRSFLPPSPSASIYFPPGGWNSTSTLISGPTTAFPAGGTITPGPVPTNLSTPLVSCNTDSCLQGLYMASTAASSFCSSFPFAPQVTPPSAATACDYLGLISACLCYNQYLSTGSGTPINTANASSLSTLSGPFSSGATGTVPFGSSSTSFGLYGPPPPLARTSIGPEISELSTTIAVTSEVASFALTAPTAIESLSYPIPSGAVSSGSSSGGLSYSSTSVVTATSSILITYPLPSNGASGSLPSIGEGGGVSSGIWLNQTLSTATLTFSTTASGTLSLGTEVLPATTTVSAAPVVTPTLSSGSASAATDQYTPPAVSELTIDVSIYTDTAWETTSTTIPGILSSYSSGSTSSTSGTATGSTSETPSGSSQVSSGSSLGYLSTTAEQSSTTASILETLNVVWSSSTAEGVLYTSTISVSPAPGSSETTSSGASSIPSAISSSPETYPIVTAASSTTALSEYTIPVSLQGGTEIPVTGLSTSLGASSGPSDTTAPVTGSSEAATSSVVATTTNAAAESSTGASYDSYLFPFGSQSNTYSISDSLTNYGGASSTTAGVTPSSGVASEEASTVPTATTGVVSSALGSSLSTSQLETDTSGVVTVATTSGSATSATHTVVYSVPSGSTTGLIAEGSLSPISIDEPWPPESYTDIVPTPMTEFGSSASTGAFATSETSGSSVSGTTPPTTFETSTTSASIWYALPPGYDGTKLEEAAGDGSDQDPHYKPRQRRSLRYWRAHNFRE